MSREERTIRKEGKLPVTLIVIVSNSKGRKRFPGLLELDILIPFNSIRSAKSSRAKLSVTQTAGGINLNTINSICPAAKRKLACLQLFAVMEPIDPRAARKVTSSCNLVAFSP